MRKITKLNESTRTRFVFDLKYGNNSFKKSSDTKTKISCIEKFNFQFVLFKSLFHQFMWPHCKFPIQMKFNLAIPVFPIFRHFSLRFYF